MPEVSMYDPSMLLWIDESGCDKRNCKRRRGYSVRGMTPVDHRTRNSVLIMSIKGIHDLYLAPVDHRTRNSVLGNTCYVYRRHS